MTEHEKGNAECKMTDAQRDWVSDAHKHVNAKYLPLAGKMLRMFDDTSTLIGRWVLLALMFGGMAGVLWFVGSKLAR